jgi:hypothetical protein
MTRISPGSKLPNGQGRRLCAIGMRIRLRRCERQLRVHIDSGRILPLTYAQDAGHTIGMKVAVSIPDDVFAEAEALAKRMKSSRSEIYSGALGEFIDTTHRIA